MIRFYLCLFTTVLAAVSCSQSEPPPEPVIRPVVTFTVPKVDKEIQRSFAGVVDSVTGTSIAFEVGGRVVEVIAKEGQKYETGQILAKLDTRELQNQLNGMEAQLIEARQSLRRTQQLFETGNASQSQLESSIARQKSTESNYKSSQKMLSDATLKMPYPGVIGNVSIDPQMVINAGQTVMTIQGEGGKEFVVGIPSEIISSFSLGMRGNIKLGSLPGAEFPAQVDSISPEVTQNTTYPVKMTFNAEDERIREGLDGEVSLTLPNPKGDALIVPSTCVASLPKEVKYVWMLNPITEETGYATVSRRTVTTGNLRAGGTIEITSGLSPGDHIVSRGVHRLDENQKVKLPTQ